MNIGLVYSGGISKCAYQIGFTQALLEYIPISDVKVASGASMGFFTAYALSTNKLAELQDIYEEINISHCFELFWQVCAKNLLTCAMNSFFSLDDFVRIPVCFPITYFPLLSTRYFWIRGNYNPFWKNYFKAAANFPFVCGMPRIIEHKLATDGGAVDNIPLYPLIKMKNEFFASKQELDLIIVMHFHPRYNYRKEFKTDIPILDIDVSINNDFKKRHFDFSRDYVNEMIASSREYGCKIAKKIFGANTSKKELTKRINEVFLSEHKERQWHDSADGLLTVFNTLGKALRNDRKCSKKLY